MRSKIIDNLLRLAIVAVAIGMLITSTTVSCTAADKRAARTVVDVARTACELLAFQEAEKQGIDPQQLVRQFCSTESDLRPWIDAVLSAQQTAGARMGARPGECPGAAAQTAPTAPAAGVAPEPPATAGSAPEGTPAPPSP